jgi:hypothetical protein
MTTYAGESAAPADFFYVPGWGNRDGPEQWTTEQLADPYGPDMTGGAMSPGSPTAAPSTFAGEEAPMPQDDWFERVILLPGTLNVGVLVSPTTFVVQLFNSYRRARKTWYASTDFAGDGISITNEPVLPVSIAPLDGYALDFRFLTTGPPRIHGWWQFDFGLVDLTLVIVGQRGILLPFPPEAPTVERMQFLTDVLERADGHERRMSLRETPRQVFDMDIILSDSARRRLNYVLLDSQSKLIDVPVWFDATVLSAAAEEGDTSVAVQSTSYRDFRVGGRAVVFQDEEVFEVLQVDAVNPTSLEFSSSLSRAFAAGAQVAPVRRGFVNEVARGEKAQVNAQRTRITFTVVDEGDPDLSDTAGFSEFEGKVLMDDPNMVEGTLPEALERRLVQYDNGTGILQVESDWDVSRRGHSKTFLSTTKQRLWQVRQVLHALRGRAVSFYIPTFFDDLLPTRSVSAGASTITVKNDGYTKFVRNRQPADVLRILLVSGASVVRRVIGSVELGEDEEQISVSEPWGIDATPAQIARVEIVEKVRLDDDEIRLVHLDSNGNAAVDVPVKAVLE